MSHVPICLNCRVAMYCHETGAFLEQMSEHRGYKIWSADVYACPNCHMMTAAGFAQQPFVEQHQDSYQDLRKQFRPRRFWSTMRDQEKYKEQHAPHPHLVETT